MAAASPARWMLDLEERARVACDADCGAFEQPHTIDEYQVALEHWKRHRFLGGCAHGGR
jgi:hypothetical protein